MVKGYTLALNVADWDLTLDDNGNLATAQGAYAVAQNVANAQRLFKRDAYFHQQRGIPHFETELGEKFSVSASVFRTRMKKEALRVDEVKDATPVLSYEENRICGCTTRVTLTDGTSVLIET